MANGEPESQQREHGGPGRASRPLTWWLGLCLLGVVEGTVTGAIRGGWAGALNGGLFGALVGPLFAAWALYVWEKRQHFFWQAVLLGAAIEAVGGLCIGWAVRQMPPHAMVHFALGLLGAVGLPALAVWGYFAGISRERTWALIGGAAGSLIGSAFLVGLLAASGPQKRGPDWLPTLGIGLFVGGVLGGLIGSFLAATVRAQVRLLQRLQIKARCRRHRLVHGGPANSEPDDLDLDDLERVAAAPAAERHYAILLLEALRDRVTAVHFASHGEVCRFQRQSHGTLQEMPPVPVPILDLAGAAARGAHLPPLRMEVWLEGTMPVRIDGHGVGLPLAVRFHPDHTQVSVHFPETFAFQEAAARLLRELRAFVGDPWSWPVGEITLRYPEHAATVARRSTNPLAEGAVVRVGFEGLAGVGTYIPFYATLNGKQVAEGTMANGLDFYATLPVGRHLLRIGPKPFWPFRHERTYVLHVAEVGRYEVHLLWSLFWGNLRIDARVIPL